MPLPLTNAGSAASGSGAVITAQPITTESGVNITTENGVTPITTEGV